ncbi:MAG: hypothetical protein K2X27_17515 [Candidatus Obscuribacterales bacterium]|nr:hypothetical protein [Candidatus Obscuribacterales bacterium]
MNSPTPLETLEKSLSYHLALQHAQTGNNTIQRLFAPRRCHHYSGSAKMRLCWSPGFVYHFLKFREANAAMTEKHSRANPEPMWPNFLALAAVGGLQLAMPTELSICGTPWMLLALVCAFLLPGEILHALGKHTFCKLIGYTVLSIITGAMILSVYLHVQALAHKSVSPDQLLGSASILWVTNILVFACWYWRLDAGGPHKRGMRSAHTHGAFLFPQMTLSDPHSRDGDDELRKWTPHFIDYLFLSFCSSTALSPTDVPVLSRWAKVLMMVQGSIALILVALLAARAVNIL